MSLSPGRPRPLTGRPWMMTNSIAEIEKASHIVPIASDPYERQPILNLRIKKAMKAGARIYIINEGATELDRFASDKITVPQHGAGMATKLLLAHALSSSISSEEHDDIRARLERDMDALDVAEKTFGPEITAQLHKLAETIATSKGAIILYDEMATLAPGCEDLAADAQALAVVTDNINRPGSGVGPLFEDANSLGARDMGLLPDAVPGYKAAPQQGLSYNEMMGSPDLKALYVMGANPLRHVAQLPPNLELLVVQDIFLTETAQQADIVLPAVTFAEKDGSMTNIDHHVQKNVHALRPLPGAKADWEILTRLANQLGQKWNYDSPQDVLLEIAASNPFYSGLTWEDLGAQGVRTQEQEVAHA